MALTAEQQAEIELQEARDAGRREHELTMETRRTRLDSLRIAQQALLEADRVKPVNERGVSATDITAFADTLVNYVN